MILYGVESIATTSRGSSVVVVVVVIVNQISSSLGDQKSGLKVLQLTRAGFEANICKWSL